MKDRRHETGTAAPEALETRPPCLMVFSTRVHERKRSRGFKVLSCIFCTKQRFAAEDLWLAIHLPDARYIALALWATSTSIACAGSEYIQCAVRECDTQPLWVRLGYLAYAGRPGSDGLSHYRWIGIQCEIVPRWTLELSLPDAKVEPTTQLRCRFLFGAKKRGIWKTYD